VVAGLYAVRSNTSSGSRDVLTSPLTRPVKQPKVPALPSDLARTYSYLSSTRIRYRHVELPWGTAAQLNRSIKAALERRGINMADASHRAAAKTVVSPLTWAVLMYSRSKARDEHPVSLRANGPKVARIVHAVLDDVDRLQGEGERRRGPQSTPQATRGAR
jgi:hypothetical protein